MPSPAVPAARRTPVLVIILLSYLMIVLDISIVITALPKMQDALGFSATSLSWVQNAYTLAFGGLLLLGARAGDILGRRRMFVVGLGLFTAASLAIGLAPSAPFLIAARVAQGVGAAVLAPSTLALLTATFPEGRERTRAVAYYGAVAGVGASLGLVVGGVLAERHLLAGRVLPQRADRHRHDDRRPAAAARDRAAHRPVRPRRRAQLDARDDRAGLRHRPLRRRGLG